MRAFKMVINKNLHKNSIYTSFLLNSESSWDIWEAPLWGKDWSRNLDSLATRWSQDFKDGILLIPGCIPLLLAGSPLLETNTSLSFNLAVSPCIYVGCNTQVFPKKASGTRPLQSFLSLLLGYVCEEGSHYDPDHTQCDQHSKHFTRSVFNHVNFLFLFTPWSPNFQHVQWSQIFLP